MELEKTLFRVHERMLSSTIIKHVLTVLVSLLFLGAIFFLGIFIYANIYFRDQSPCLNKEYEAFKAQITNNTDLYNDETLLIKIVTLKPEYKNKIYSQNFFNLTEFLENNTNSSNNTLNPNNFSNPFINRSDPRNLSDFYEHPALFMMEMVQMPQLLSLPRDTRIKHEFVIHQILIDVDCYTADYFLKEIVLYYVGLENIIINEILVTFHLYSTRKNDVILKNIFSDEIWFWNKENIKSYGWKYNIFYEIMVRIANVLAILIGIFLISNITAIYIKMTIICAPIFILIITECCLKFGANEHFSRLHVFKAFPWVGIYLYALAYNNRKAEKYIYFAFICMIFLFYFVYLGSSTLWTFFLFRKSIPNGLDENFYGFVACIEFLSILFIRTRSSFKFIPIFLNFLFFFFLYYVKFTIYGYYYLALYFTVCLSFGYFGLNLILFEIPALSWNPSYHYVPSMDKPRVLYFPLFSISSYYDLPHFWSMFYPLHDRSYFTTPQMSLIDRNFILLNTTMENARQNNHINNNNNNNELNFDFEMQNLLNPAAHPNNPIPAVENNRPVNVEHVPENLIHEEDNSIHQNLLRNSQVRDTNLESIAAENPVNQRNLVDIQNLH